LPFRLLKSGSSSFEQPIYIHIFSNNISPNNHLLFYFLLSCLTDSPTWTVIFVPPQKQLLVCPTHPVIHYITSMLSYFAISFLVSNNKPVLKCVTLINHYYFYCFYHCNEKIVTLTDRLNSLATSIGTSYYHGLIFSPFFASIELCLRTTVSTRKSIILNNSFFS